MKVATLVLKSSYRDSLVLMRLAQELRGQPGVIEAAALMATPANLEILAAAGLATAESATAGPGDLVLAVGAADDARARAAIDFATARSAPSGTGGVEAIGARTLDRALEEQPRSNLVAISVPGPYARLEAMRALKRGLHVFLFSDNVPVDDEIDLKRYAAGRGLLCMGPDCGTAYLGGIGIGFANVVPRGPIGLVAASGTGMQAVAAEIANLGSGISHGIGVGGRDLTGEVGGLMTFAALRLLVADPDTRLIVLVSKPPAPEVMARLDELLGSLPKPVVVCCIGAAAPPVPPPNVQWAPDLASAAAMAVARLAGRPYANRPFAAPDSVRQLLGEVERDGSAAGRSILGLFTGGTLASEAAIILRELVGDVGDTPPAPGTTGHRIVDLGDDHFTLGRPHPMLAPETRAERVLPWTVSPTIGVVLLDCVLGRGAHADPLAGLLEVIGESRERARADGRILHFVASVVGTDQDPQGTAAQRQRLRAAGVAVLDNNAEAARFAALLVEPALRATLLEGS